MSQCLRQSFHLGTLVLDRAHDRLLLSDKINAEPVGNVEGFARALTGTSTVDHSSLLPVLPSAIAGSPVHLESIDPIARFLRASQLVHSLLQLSQLRRPALRRSPERPAALAVRSQARFHQHRWREVFPRSSFNHPGTGPSDPPSHSDLASGSWRQKRADRRSVPTVPQVHKPPAALRDYTT